MEQRRTVVIAVDEGEHSEFAFNFYLENVQRESDRVILVHVPEYSKIFSMLSLLTDPNIISELLRDYDERVSDLVEKYSKKLKENHLTGQVTQKYGKPGEAIVETTQEEGADVLIMGTRALGRLKRTFKGSVSDYCLHHTHVPIMICKQKDSKHS